MNFYDALDVHRLMVADDVRTRAFFDSIAATIHRGDVVLDVGAGSGILSLFAARAGASRVYAIERAPGAAALARRLVRDNGFEHLISVIEGDAVSVVLPERVDAIVSEWLGSYGVDENMLAPVLVARDRWLKPEGKMIPAAVTAWIAPVRHSAAIESTLFRQPRYGMNLSALAPFDADEAIWLPRGCSVDALCAAPQAMWVTDCQTMAASAALRPHSAQLAFAVERGGINGLVTWFTAEMPGTSPLSNAPGGAATHWGQFLFPLAGAAQFAPGDVLKVDFHNVPWGDYGSQHIWALRTDRALEVHDTRRSGRWPWQPPWRVYDPSSALTSFLTHADGGGQPR